MQESLHIADLIVREIRGTISPQEEQELEQWLAADEANRRIYEKATDPAAQLTKMDVYVLFREDKVRTALEDQLFGTKTRRLHPRSLMRYAAILALPVIAVSLAVIYFLRPPEALPLADIDRAIKSGTERGVLVLSNGTEIELTDTFDMAAIAEGEATIRKQTNSLVYVKNDGTSPEAAAIVYNELRTPAGGSYKLQLANGSQVWLNAGSTLKFPVTFEEASREVFLQGEGYFEVVHDGKPFIVHAGATRTQVLGTTFNISAYADDEQVVTTLQEGKVQVGTEGNTASQVLVPNEQAVYVNASAELRKTQVDASGYTSWVNGRMEFHNENLEVVMKRLSRWYDFDYSFENESVKEYHFSARLSRKAPVSEILKMLEMSAHVNFAWEDGVIVIK